MNSNLIIKDERRPEGRPIYPDKNNRIEEYSSDFIIVRRAVFMCFIAANAPITERDLTPEACVNLIYDIGQDYINKNKAGLSKLPEKKND